ncbi:hypothetical protein HYV80_05365 [Candidatus Woesearchaeota archaeon]|nr:hypothetical protein [Candidatus Woesearchaeota archaeon]
MADKTKKFIFNRIAVWAFMFALIISPAAALTYTKNSFPTFSGNVITCDGNDLRISCQDSGDGRNHFCSTFGANGCRAVEGRDNYGGPGCLITCQKEDRCSDNTPFGQCSTNNPFYCDAGTLVRRSSICGCVFPQVRSGEDCITPPACGDGTLSGQCSTARPFFCSNGFLVNRASSCGCPSGQTASGDNCIPGTGTPGAPPGTSPAGPTTLGAGQRVPNKLLIIDIDAKVDGKSSSNIRNNGKISKDAKPDSEVELTIELRNNFTSSEGVEIQNIAASASIENIDNEDDIEQESESFDLRADSDKTMRFKFRIPLNAEEGTYSIFIEAEGEDENGNDHKDEADIELEIEKDAHDLKIVGFGISPKEIGCSRNAKANVKIANIGEEEEESAFIEIKSESLNLGVKENINVKSDSNGNIVSRLLEFSVSSSAEKGVHIISANAYSEDGNLKDQRTAEINVEGCDGLIEEGNVVLQISPPSQAKKQEKAPSLFSFRLGGFDPITAILLLALIILILFALIVAFALAQGEKAEEEYY